MTDDESTQYTGHYTRAFLNALVGEDKYTVRSFPLADDRPSVSLSTQPGHKAAMEALEDPDLSFGYMSDDKLTLVWLHDYPGWMNFTGPLGITIQPSAKIAKRLTVMTRLAYLHLFCKPHQINIGSVTPDAFTRYDFDDEMAQRVLDGANVISRELVERMMTNGSRIIEKKFKQLGRGNPWNKTFINRAIDRAGSVSLRVITNEGLIKGDALIAPATRIGGYDILTVRETNVKFELKADDFVFVLAEPHPSVRKHEFSRSEPAPPPVWTDDQTMSWLGDWLYPKEQLLQSLRDYAQTIYNEIAEGEYPEFFTNTTKRSDEHSTITQFQSQALRWEEEGLGLDQSIFLQRRVGQGAVNQLTKQDKRRWPVPCAMYVHVANDSWLHMAGYYQKNGEHPWPFEDADTPRGYVWYHEESGRLIYNDLDFVELYERHGGWDLDDSVKAHARTVGGKRKWIIVRSPNSYGEYDIKNYAPGTFAPTWTQPDGSEMTFPPLEEERPPFLEELDPPITYKHKSLKPSRTWPSNYTRDMLKDAVEMARKFRGVFGRRANADIVWFGTVGDYRKKQLAPIEAIVDACTQEQSMWAHKLITEETEDIIHQLRTMDIEVDETLWKERVKRTYPGIKYRRLKWSKLSILHDNLCSVYQDEFFELAQNVVNNIDRDVLRLGKLCETRGRRLTKKWYELRREVLRDSDETLAEFLHRINAMMCQVLEHNAERVIYDQVLGMARYTYTHTHRQDEYSDTPLFQSGATVFEPSLFDYYIRALNFYGVGNPHWRSSVRCSGCGALRSYDATERVDYQMHLRYENCEECRVGEATA